MSDIINKEINILTKKINTNIINFNEEKDKKYVINSLNIIKKLINNKPKISINNDINKIKTQYHHYIPQFILKKFNVNKNVNDKRNNKIKYYNIISNKLEECKTNKKYGVQDLYKNINNDDIMEIEKELGKLENKCSILIENIIKSCDYVEIKRKDLYELKKFLYVMMYRKKERNSQYVKNNFDNDTKKALNEFMEKYNFKTYNEVWLNNIKEILKTDYNGIKYNNKIFSYIRWEFTSIMGISTTCIWEAKENDEFIITSNCFGIYEGYKGNIYHYFYVISPKKIIVLTNNIKLMEQSNYIGMFPKYIHKNTIPKYKNKIVYDILKLYPGIIQFIEAYYDDEDSFYINFEKLNNNIVYIINSIFLEEENESITFISSENLYNSIKSYESNKELILKRNYNQLKMILDNKNIVDNHKNISSFPYDKYIDKEDLIKLFKYNNSYFLEILVKQTEILSSTEKQNIMENGYPIDILPDRLQLKEGIIIRFKEIIETYLSQMNQIIYVYTDYEIKLINKELLNIPLVNIILKHNIDNNNETIINLYKVFKI